MTPTHISRKPKGTKTGRIFVPQSEPGGNPGSRPAAEPRPKVDFAQRQQELLEQLFLRSRWRLDLVGRVGTPPRFSEQVPQLLVRQHDIDRLNTADAAPCGRLQHVEVNGSKCQ